MASFSTTTLDTNGVPRLLDDDVRDVRFHEISSTTFANPDSEFTGYAANGFFYAAGQPDPTHDPFKAGWASEGEGEGDENRGPVDAFPDRVLVVTTASEVVILDADSLDVWMRFVLGGSSTYGTFLGLAAAEIRAADLRDGVLVVATDAGVRVADFRGDVCMVLGASASTRSGTGADGIADRNTDGVLEDTVLVGATRLVVSDDVLCARVGAGRLDAVTPAVVGPVAVVGHHGGLTAIQLPALESPETKRHFLEITGGSWSASDDADGDSTTPYLYDDVGDAELRWVNKGVRAGDIVVLDTGAEHVVTGIDVVDDVLSLDPEIDVGSVGASYAILRSVPVVHLEPGDRLYAAYGQQKVILVDDGSVWYGSNLNVLDEDEWVPTSDCVVLSDEVGAIRAVAVTAGDLYVATDIGVFRSLAADFDRAGQPSATYLYSGGDTELDATYEILEGGFSDCRAVVIDPETGHLAVAATDGATSVLTEIDLSIHQAFRYEEYDSVVQAVYAYRNTAGPPDEDVD